MEPEESCSGAPLHYWTWWLPAFALLWLAAVFSLAAEPVALIKQNCPIVLVGFGAAVLGNLSAIGGGIVFIPVMIFLYHTAPVAALKVALSTQSFGMTSGAIAWIQTRVVPLKALRLTIPGLLIGSTISSLVIKPSTLLVKAFFGPVSIFLGILTIVLALHARGRVCVQDVPDRACLPLILVSVFGGLITGWVAIGEGEVIAALLMLAYGLEPRSCIGLGVVLLAINSIYLTLIHQFALGGIPWDLAAFTILGCVFGARFAPYVAQWVSPFRMKLSFALIAIADGVLFVIQFLLRSKA